MDSTIKKADKKLDYLSSDKETHEIVRAREDSLHERANLISTGREEGRLEGRLEGKLEGKLEAAKALLDILDDKTIAQRLELSEDEVRRLRE